MTDTFCASSPLRFTPSPAPGRRWRGWLIAALSVAVHVLIVGHISFSLPSHKPAPSPVMSARLMAPVTVTPPTSIAVESTPEEVTPDQAAQAPVSQPKPRLADKDKRPTQAATLSEHTAPAVTSKPATEASQDSDAALITPSIDTRQALDSYMASQHQRAVHQDSANAAAAFQQSKQTVEISDPRKDTLLDPQVERPAPTRVNCSSELNKTLALLSGIAGGTLRCSDQGDIAPHIEKRINAHTNK